MKNQKGFALLALLIPAAIILIGLVAFGRYYYLPKVNENKNANTNQVAVNTNLNQNTNATVVVDGNTNLNLNTNTSTDETAEWKTYTNTTYGYSFKYPASFQLNTQNQPTEVVVSNENTGNIKITLVHKQYNVDDLISDQSEYTGIASKSVGGKNGYAYGYADAGWGFSYIKLPLNYETIIISFSSSIEMTNSISDNATFQNQVLSTFQFTDETAVWKTYNNSTYKYQIKYPDNWFTKSCTAAYTAFASVENRLPPCETEAWGDVQISVNEDTLAAYYQEDITQTKAYLNVTSETDITVGGITAKRLAGTTKAMEGPGPEEGTEEIYVVFMTGGNMYHLIYYKNTDNDYSDIFDQMVSTFEFVE
ncbi:MAG: PsbP-related protein [Patescibacteria group bacterium]